MIRKPQYSPSPLLDKLYTSGSFNNPSTETVIKNNNDGDVSLNNF